MSPSTAIEDLDGSSKAVTHLRPSAPASCQPQIVPDTPAEQDLLGPHQRVAAAIAAVVTGQKGGKAIALRGTWGSGKSTVVELLQRALATATDSNRTQVFVYDAWAHQGDPLRRSFLEQITSFLHEKQWIDRENFRAKLDELRRRREHVTSKSTPLLTTYGSAVVTNESTSNSEAHMTARSPALSCSPGLIRFAGSGADDARQPEGQSLLGRHARSGGVLGRADRRCRLRDQLGDCRSSDESPAAQNDARQTARHRC